MIRKILLALSVVSILTVACTKDFLNINSDPNNPTSIEAGKLLSTAERTLGDALSMDEENGGLSQILAVYVHQMSTREEPDQYGIVGSDGNIQMAWGKLYGSTPDPGTTFPIYGVLNNLEDVIAKSTAAGNLRYVGIAKILKAYTYSLLVDAFGDVPFTEANKLKEGIVYPKFDDDAAIYDSLFKMINSGIADLNNTAINPQRPGADDLIYGGNVARWTKAANTLKLKMYTQIRKVRNVTAEVTALINSGNLISQTSESFLIPYGPNGATDDRNPGFFDYIATQRSNHVSPWFYETLKGINPFMHTLDNPDPRLPYYIYNQVNATQVSRDGNQTEYRDGPFVSIIFGSVGPDRDRTQQNTISLFGIYPVGGKYDDGSATIANANSGTGAAPYRLITYADRLYLEAELINTGVITGDARAKLDEAIRESFRQVDYVITQHVRPSQNVPAVYNATAASPMNIYIDKVMAAYDAGNTAKKLEIIITQKWLSSVGSAVDQYTDLRRTGYPIIFNPLNPSMAPGGRVQPPINGDPIHPGAQASVPVQLSKSFPLSLPWFQEELETNPNAPSQKVDLSQAKVFWIP